VAIDHRFEAAGVKLDELWAGIWGYTADKPVSRKAADNICRGLTFETLERLKVHIVEIIENG